MKETFARTEMLIGDKAMEALSCARVAVFGIGGVGGYVVEALVRSGVGAIDIIDHDVISESNINRQIIADVNTIGRPKTEVMHERIARINPDCKVTEHRLMYLPDTADRIHFRDYTYVVDAVDTVTAKLLIIERAKEAGVPVISCMGTAGKLNPGKLTIGDISETSICPLARVMRKELKARGISDVKVCYSTEKPIKTEEGRPGSSAIVPPSAGLLIAGEVIKEIGGMH